ncbi:hypothetical protein V2J09_013215 [Rumex salicifolius]
MANGYDLNHLIQEAKKRWLMPDELLFVIQNHEPEMIQKHAHHQMPASGSLFLFNRKDVPCFRGDGHNWRKRSDKNTVKEAHENLKVGDVRALACYYAYGADDPNFRRRIYWMLYVHLQSHINGHPHQKNLIRKISPEWCFSDEITEEDINTCALLKEIKSYNVLTFERPNFLKELSIILQVVVIGNFCYDPSKTVWAMFGDVKVEAQFIQDGVICCQAPSNRPGKVSFCITSINRDSCSDVKEFEYRDRNNAFGTCINQQQQQQQQQQPPQVKDGRMEDGKLLVEFVEMLSADSSLQEVLKEKLQKLLQTRFQEADFMNSSCLLRKKEKGIIHLVAGLGYEWALQAILDSGVGVNFRDNNGWTALHWAARFGREKMVCALITSGALVSAVTDPTAQDPLGKNAASIAEANEHEGLAAYLSAFALTTRFSELTIDHDELSNTTPNEFVEDEISMKWVLEVNRNTAIAAGHIQTAFRVHSFKKRQKREAATRSLKKRNAAAVTIQRYYRGHRLRMYYRVVRVVGIMEMIMLRWRRKRYILRDVKLEGEAMVEDEEDDVFQAYSRKKLDTTVRRAFKNVHSIIHSREARAQYSRMLRAFRHAKAKLGVSTQEEALVSLASAFGNDDTADDAFKMPFVDRPASPDTYCQSFLKQV